MNEKRKKLTGIQIAGIIAGTAVLGSNAILAKKLPALGKNQGFLKNYIENIKFVSKMPIEMLRGKNPAKLVNQRFFGADKLYKLKLGPEVLYSKTHQMTSDNILKATRGKQFGISDFDLKNLKKYLNRPGIRDRADRLVYPHEVGQLGINPRFERIKNKIALVFYNQKTTAKMLEKAEREAISKGYKKIMGSSHFDPAQLATAGYKEVKGVNLIDSIIKNVAYKSIIKKTNKEFYTKGHAAMNPNKVYFRSINPNTIRTFTKDLSDPAQVGIGQTKEIIRSRLKARRNIIQNPTNKQKFLLKEERIFSKKYKQGLQDMYASDFDSKYLKQKSKFKKQTRLKNYKRTAIIGGVTAGSVYGMKKLKFFKKVKND